MTTRPATLSEILDAVYELRSDIHLTPKGAHAKTHARED